MTEVNNCGGCCIECHSGDTFSNEEFHASGAPQFGSGKGSPNGIDFGH